MSETGDDLKKAGMDTVLSREINYDWKIQFAITYHWYVKSGQKFTAEEIIEVVGMPPGHVNVIGAWFNALLRPDLVSGEVIYLGNVKSTRPSRHANRAGQYQRKENTYRRITPRSST